MRGITLEDIVSQQMKDSVVLIETLVLNLTRQYNGKLIHWIKFGFSLAWNNIRKFFGLFRPKNEFYPLLTDLIREIYDIFGYKKSKTDCNEFIKNSLFNYFKIDNNGDISFEKFKNDIINFRNLFGNTEKNFKFESNLKTQLLTEGVFEIDDDKFTSLGKVFLE